MPNKKPAFDRVKFTERFGDLITGSIIKMHNRKKYTYTKLASELNKSGFNFTAAQLGKFANVEDSTVPKIDIVAEIARFFNVSIDFLIGSSNSISTDEISKSVNKRFGLSDSAMNNLEKWKKDSMSAFPFAASKIIDEIIKNETFVSKIEIALNNIMKLRNNHLHEQMSEAEYEEKIAVNKYLASRAFEVLFDELYSALEKKWETQMKKFSKDSEPLF